MDTLLTGLSAGTPVPLTPPQQADADTPREGTRLRFRRIYILPTRQGLGFALAVLVMLLGSINYGNALGYVLSFMLVGVGLVSMLHAVRNLAGLRLDADNSAPVFAQARARFALTVDNRGQRRRFGLLARIRSGAEPHGDDAVHHFGIDADSVAHIELPSVAPRRGWYMPGPVTIATRFPFGLFRAWSRNNIGLRCLAYPRPQGQCPLPEPLAEENGEHGTLGAGEDEFAGLRDYRLGDSARRVHWKAVARGQKVPVKIFSGAAAGVVWLRWQDLAGLDTEARLSQLSRWVVEADEKRLRYGLRIPGLRVPADVGEQHRHRCLAALALYEDSPAR
jgi:uncharacterized protein (DUF58 family)